MGIFSSKKKIHVASVAYNLAGGEEDRKNFLKLNLLGIIRNEQNLYIGESLSKAYLNGPGIRLRNFANWAERTGYTKDIIKQSGGTLALPSVINQNIVAEYINPSAPQNVLISVAEVGRAEYNYWAMQYMMENHIEVLEGDWGSSFDDVTGEVVIVFYDSEGEIESQETFIPAGYNKDARYLYAVYKISQAGEDGPIEEGPTIIHDTDPPPDTAGWSLISSDTVSVDYDTPTTVHTLVEYSDATPPAENTVTTPGTTTESQTDSVWEKVTYLGSLPDVDAVGNLREVLNIFEEYVVKEDVEQDVLVEDIGGGVTKTTTTTTTTRYTEIKNSSRLDTQINTLSGWTPSRVMIYQEGSGDSNMDTQFMPTTSIGGFFPIIPVRLWNEFLSPTNHPELYTKSKKALKKAVDYNYDKIVESLADNESLGDIDHAFINFGVSLNTKEVASKRYIYEFFRQIHEGLIGIEYQDWEADFEEAEEKQTLWREWKDAQSDPLNPLFGTPEPEYMPISSAPGVDIRVNTDSTNTPIDYDVNISWSGSVENIYPGLMHPGAKKGDIEIVNGDLQEDEVVLNTHRSLIQHIAVNWRDVTELRWQDTATSYRVLKILGLNYRNVVYQGKSVNITGREALDDEEESGFIVPLHVNMFRSMPLTQSTQMSQACGYMVLNCWHVTKKRWYQRGVFQVILVVAIVVVFVYTGYFSAEGAGALGTNASVGAALGFTGTAAIVAGVIANAVAAIIVTQLVTAGATELFGDRWGNVIGMLASIFVLNMATNAAAGKGWALNYEQLMKPEGIMQITAAVGKGISHEIQMQAMKKFEETAAIIADYEEQSKRIAELYSQNIGDGSGLDLMAIQEISSQFDFNPEAPTDFLTRTLMTGTDIVKMSHALIEQFPEITTSLKLP